MVARILIVEDEPAIAEVISYALQQEQYLTTHTTLGQQAIALHQAQCFDSIILDIGLPDTNGFEVCKQLRQFSHTPILMLTARTDEIDRIVGLEIGADDYMHKPFSPRELVARVRAQLRRSQYATSAAQHTSAFSVDEASGRIVYYEKWLDLTRYEFLLLKTLLKHQGRIYTRAELMDNIWQDALDTSDRTVDTHIKNLRAKLAKINPNTSPIITHRGMGYSVS
jgi:two-component system, OmpR family, catabolic regulation response regulator CreB